MNLLNKQNFYTQETPQEVDNRVYAHINTQKQTKKFRIDVRKFTISIGALSVLLLVMYLSLHPYGDKTSKYTINVKNLDTALTRTINTNQNGIGSIDDNNSANESKKDDIQFANEELDKTLKDVDQLLALLDDQTSREIN